MKKTILGTAIILSIGSFVWSALSLTKLGNIGDGDLILSPLRILERNVAVLALAIILVVAYLWLHDKER